MLLLSREQLQALLSPHSVILSSITATSARLMRCVNKWASSEVLMKGSTIGQERCGETSDTPRKSVAVRRRTLSSCQSSVLPQAASWRTEKQKSSVNKTNGVNRREHFKRWIKILTEVQHALRALKWISSKSHSLHNVHTNTLQGFTVYMYPTITTLPKTLCTIQISLFCTA